MSLTDVPDTTSGTTPAALVAPHELADEAIALVRRWLTESRDEPVDAAAQRLAGVLRDANGLDFTVGFVDGVVRPEDVRVAARNLSALAPLIPGSFRCTSRPRSASGRSPRRSCRRWSSPPPARRCARWCGT